MLQRKTWPSLRGSSTTLHYRHLACFFLVLLVAGPSSLAGPVAAAAKAAHHRKQTRYDSVSRHLLQNCGSCPAQSDAQATCNALPDSTRMKIRNSLIANCGSALLAAGLGTSQCCSSLPAQGSEEWMQWVHCMCYSGDGLTGLSAFVNPQDVLNACGCGQQASPPPSAAPSASGGLARSALPPSAGAAASSNVSAQDIVNQVLGGQAASSSSANASGPGASATASGTSSGGGASASTSATAAGSGR